ncbi:hypothetical protein D3C85_1452780 [compost metagenome]
MVLTPPITPVVVVKGASVVDVAAVVVAVAFPAGTSAAKTGVPKAAIKVLTSNFFIKNSFLSGLISRLV